MNQRSAAVKELTGAMLLVRRNGVKRMLRRLRRPAGPGRSKRPELEGAERAQWRKLQKGAAGPAASSAA